jgi:hypothetical protein
MALPGEQHAIGNTDCAEDPPTGKESDLPGREDPAGRFADLIVVKDE